MMTFKRIDVNGQLGLILISLLVALIPSTRGLVFYGYFLVGGWQLISAGVHQFNRNHLLLSDSRRNYHRCLALVVGIGVSCFLFHEIIYFYLFGLLLFSPIMAIWYLVFSLHELDIWKAKALVHLK
jgi:hypothetical protein